MYVPYYADFQRSHNAWSSHFLVLSSSSQYSTRLLEVRQSLKDLSTLEEKGIPLEYRLELLRTMRTICSCRLSTVYTLYAARATAIICRLTIDSILEYKYDAVDPRDMVDRAFADTEACLPPEPLLRYLVKPVRHALRFERLAIARCE